MPEFNAAKAIVGQKKIDDYFGKEFGQGFLDPNDPRDTPRALAPFVPRRIEINRMMRKKGQPERQGRGPLSPLENVWLKAVMNNIRAREKRGGAPLGPRDLEQVRRQRRPFAPEAFDDPNRPIFDMTGKPISPKFFNPRTQQWEVERFRP